MRRITAFDHFDLRFMQRVRMTQSDSQEIFRSGYARRQAARQSRRASSLHEPLTVAICRCR